MLFNVVLCCLVWCVTNAVVVWCENVTHSRMWTCSCCHPRVATFDPHAFTTVVSCSFECHKSQFLSLCCRLAFVLKKIRFGKQSNYHYSPFLFTNNTVKRTATAIVESKWLPIGGKRWHLACAGVSQFLPLACLQTLLL